MSLSIDNAGKRWKAIQRNLLAWISGIPLPLDVWNSGWEIFYPRLYFSWCLLARTANLNKTNRLCYYVQKGHGFRENLVSVIVSTFLICMFVDQLLLDRGCVFSAVLFNLFQKNQKCRIYRYKSLKSWKIDNIHLKQFIDFHRFPLSIDKNHLIAIDFYRYRFLSIDYSGISKHWICMAFWFTTLIWGYVFLS